MTCCRFPRQHAAEPYAPFRAEGYDLSERPANGSVTTLDFDTSKPIAEAVTVVSYNQ